MRSRAVVVSWVILAAVLAAGWGAFHWRASLFPWRPGAAAAAEEAPADPYRMVGADVIEADAEAVSAAGLRSRPVSVRNLPVTLTVTARTGLDMESVTHVHAQYGGKVTRVTPELGAIVRGPEAPGGPTVLCVIESNDLAQAKAAYLQAKIQLKLDADNLGRTRELVRSLVLAEKFLVDAESAVTKDTAALDAARQQLLVFGLSQGGIDEIESQQGKQRMDYVITCPRSGVIAEKGVAGGEIADPTINLFTIADTSRIWVWGDVYERDLHQVKVGDAARVVFTSDPDHPRDCRIDWISPVLDPNTHSIRVRGTIDNTARPLLADMYGTMVVTVDPGSNSMVVPGDAVVRRGSESFVFVQVESSGGSARYRRVAVKVAPVDAGFGTTDAGFGTTDAAAATAATSAGGDTSLTGGTAAAGGLIRVTSGLSAGQLVVESGALGLFNEMQQHER
jgi:cobalt-zinc-cadmium efflux system membrane fusion protein